MGCIGSNGYICVRIICIPISVCCIIILNRKNITGGIIGIFIDIVSRCIIICYCSLDCFSISPFLFNNVIHFNPCNIWVNRSVSYENNNFVSWCFGVHIVQTSVIGCCVTKIIYSFKFGSTLLIIFIYD